MFKRWTKIIALVLVLALVGAMAVGCTGTKTPAADGSGDTSGSKLVGSKDKVYYMVTFLAGYSYWTECWRGFQDAANLFGVTAAYGGSQEYDVSAAVTSFEQIIATNPDGIAVTAMDANAYIEPINKAMDNGIPVVMFDSDAPDSNRIAFIGTSNYTAGANAAKYIGEALGGTGRVACVTTTGQSNINERITGFTETLAAQYPNIEMVQVVDSGADEATCAANVGALLANDKDLDYIFCALLLASTGTQQALAEAGLTGQIKLVAFDTDNVTLDAIGAGAVEATVAQSPYCQGFWTMVYLYMIDNDCISSVDDWLAKGYPSLPTTAMSPSTVIDSSTYELYYTDN